MITKSRRDKGRGPIAGGAEGQCIAVVPPPSGFHGIEIEDERYADPKYWLLDPLMMFNLRLTEAVPGDNPPELSGTVLHFNEYGEWACLGVYIGTHCLGYLDERPLRQFLVEAYARANGDERLDRDSWSTASLGDLYAGFAKFQPSGAILICSGLRADTQLAVLMQDHCFGWAHGPKVKEFLRRGLLRAQHGCAEKDWKYLSPVAEFDRDFLAELGINPQGLGAEGSDLGA
jgi:hypothetical protein